MELSSFVKRHYLIDTKIAASVRLIHSYAKESALPVAFVHYKHKRPSGEFQKYQRKNDYTTIFIFAREGIHFVCGDTLYTPAFGDALLFGEDVPFASTYNAADQSDYYEIDLPRGFADLLYHENPFSSLLSNANRSPLISLPAGQKRELMSLLQEMEKTEGDLLLYAKLILLSDMLEKGKGAAAETKKIPRVLARGMEYMHERYTEIGGAEEVARYLGVSTTYLSRLFGRVLGCTTTDYLNRLRLSRAKDLLLAGESVTEACYAAGFGSYTYFITKFKEETGITPAKFRAKNAPLR